MNFSTSSFFVVGNLKNVHNILALNLNLARSSLVLKSCDTAFTNPTITESSK